MSREQIGWNVHFSYDATRDEQSVFAVQRDANGRRHILNVDPSGTMLMTEMTGQKVEPTFRSRHVEIDSVMIALAQSLKDRGINPEAEAAAVKARLADAAALNERLLGHLLSEDSKQRARTISVSPYRENAE